MASGYLAVCDDGLQVRASLPGDGSPRLWFGQDAAIPLVDPITHIPEAAVGISASRVDLSHVAMVRGHHDHAFRVTRSGVITNLGSVVGTNAVWVAPTGDVSWIKSVSQWCVNTAANWAEVPKDSSGQYVSGQGWTQIVSGTPAWTAFVGYQTIDGRLLARCVRIGVWTVGMDTTAPRILAYRHDTETWWLVANTDTQTGPQCVLGVGGLLVAISGNPCFVVDEQEFTALQPPPVVIPKFQKTTQKIGMGLFDDFAGPRIADLSEAITPNVRAIFWQIGTNGRSQSKALAKSIGWGALAYKDGYGLKPSQVPDGFRALVFAYPDEDLSVGASVKKVSDALTALTDEGVPCDLAVALYCQYRAPGDYALPVQKVMDTLTRVWDLGIQFDVGACWGFTKRRVSGGQVVDGVEYWPELQECYRRLQAASGDWLHFPPYAPAPPPDTFWAPLGDLHV